MRVVLLTGQAPHHKYLCAELSKARQLAGIIHPLARSKNAGARLLRRWRTHGLGYTALHFATRLPGAFCGWNSFAEEQRLEAALFSDSVRAYGALDPGMIHRGIDVRSPAALELMRDLKANVAVCLGGALYPKELIEAVPLMLNYHSGLSPLYNGCSSYDFAFANGHPHLCGGTLMRMNTVVDGGDILAHYLPDIDAADTPAALFMKTVRGAALLYDRFLGHLERNGVSFSAIAQPRPLFYYQGIDWTLFHTLRVRRHLEKKLAAKFSRPARTVEYWREPDGTAARRLFETTLAQLLWDQR